MSDELVVLSMQALACAAKACQGRLTDQDVLSLLIDLATHAPCDDAWRAVVLGFEHARHADQAEAGRLLEAWLTVRSRALAAQAERLRTALAACAPLDPALDPAPLDPAEGVA